MIVTAAGYIHVPVSPTTVDLVDMADRITDATRASVRVKRVDPGRLYLEVHLTVVDPTVEGLYALVSDVHATVQKAAAAHVMWEQTALT